MFDTNKENKAIDRRAFLKYSGILGASLVFSGIIPVSESVAFNRKLYKVTGVRLEMGTFVAITLMHPSKGEAEDVIGMTLDEMSRVSRLFNRYQSGSPIGMLNHEGCIYDLPPDVIKVISRSFHFHKLSKGAFDITVKPVVDLYKDHFAACQTPPSDEAVNRVLDLVDLGAVHFNSHTIRFTKEGMGITLDGIAKGYIIDRGIQVIKQSGVKHGLINSGGDIRTIGGRDEKTPWKVAIQNPAKYGSYLSVISMTNGAVATSGNYEVYFDKEKLYHHIINPENGRSAHQSSSVTVLAGNAMDADALSTAVFVSGAEAGKKFIENLPGTECLILSSKGGEITSRGWPPA